MPKGFGQAQKVGTRNYDGFRSKPKGVVYLSLKANDERVVRFLNEHEEIEWLRQWKLAPNSSFQWGEKIPCVDQFEDGTPDPGYAANLKSTFTAYPMMIWRNAPVYQKSPDGSLVRDENKNKILTGYADQVAVWECAYSVYEILREVANDYRGLMSRDFKIKRTGSGSKDTRYHVAPAMVDGGPQPLSPADMQLAATGRPNLTDWLRVPTYEELHAYIYGDTAAAAAPAGFTQQTQTNDINASGGAVVGNPFLS